MNEWTFCRDPKCGARSEGNWTLCPKCNTSNVHVQDIGWTKESSGDIFPGKEEQG